MTTQILKNFLTKKDFDYDCPNLDIFKFHPQLRVLLIFNGIFFNNPDSYLRFIWPVLCGSLALVASALQLLCIYHGVTVQDYSSATECFCYLIIVSSSPIIFTSVLLYRDELVGLLNSMNKDFQYICSLESHYRSTFMKGQLLIWQLCIVWFSFVFCIAVMYVGRTVALLIYQSLFATQAADTVRPLMFPLWLPADDPYRTPNYEVFLFLEILAIIVVLQSTCVYIYFLFHIMLHHYYLMIMITFDCDALFVGLDESVVKLSRYDPRRTQVQATLNSRMGRIVNWHNLVFETVDTVSYIYGPPLIYQLMFSSLPICLMAYQVADSIDHGEFNVIFATVCVANCLQLWITCYLGTLIRDKAFSVGDAIWSSGWHQTPLGRLLRADITLVIMRSQIPISIKFTGLPGIELETFSSIMSTAYSYFTLLRQYTSENK